VTPLDLLTLPYSVSAYLVGYGGGLVSPTGDVFAAGNPGDLVPPLGQFSVGDIYRWTPNGARADLSALLGAPGSNGGAALLAVHWPWVIWANGTSSSCASGNYYVYPLAGTSFVAYNAVSGEVDTIAAPASNGGVEAVDFYLSNAGTPVLYFGASNCSGSNNVFLWTEATQQVTAVTTNNISYDPASDGAFLAWREQPTNSPPYPLLVTNLSNNSTQTLTTNVQYYWVGGRNRGLDRALDFRHGPHCLRWNRQYGAVNATYGERGGGQRRLRRLRRELGAVRVEPIRRHEACLPRSACSSVHAWKYTLLRQQWLIPSGRRWRGVRGAAQLSIAGGCGSR
jgi:hypothetical protein